MHISGNYFKCVIVKYTIVRSSELISFDNNNDIGDENKAGQALKDLSLTYSLLKTFILPRTVIF